MPIFSPNIYSVFLAVMCRAETEMEAKLRVRYLTPGRWHSCSDLHTRAQNTAARRRERRQPQRRSEGLKRKSSPCRNTTELQTVRRKEAELWLELVDWSKKCTRLKEPHFIWQKKRFSKQMRRTRFSPNIKCSRSAREWLASEVCEVYFNS